MNLTIKLHVTDFKKQVIITESCNLKLLNDFLKTAFPDDYHEFEIISETVHVNLPYIIPDSSPTIQPYTYPSQSFSSPYIYTEHHEGLGELVPGTHFFQITSSNK